MNALETALAETAQWAIVDTLYFDSVMHSFIRADIEIDGARIAAVLPPATSKRMTRLAGETAVCLPGLIDPDVGSNCEDWSACLQSLAMRGVTTAGTFCRNDFDCRRVAGAEGIRRLCYVEFGAHDPPDESIDANQEEWQRFERAIDAMTSSRCELLPAVVPEKIGSAAALLAAAKLAHELRRRLCIRLCSTAPDAQRYKETRFFTELGLLSYLSLLTNATIFDLSQISRTTIAFAPDSEKVFVEAVKSFFAVKPYFKEQISEMLNCDVPIYFCRHHQSHAASAFFPSPFPEAAVLCVDGVGEWVTTSLALGRGREIEMLKEIRYPHSLGLLYSAFTHFCGFKVNSGEYKLMGLAPYGRPVYANEIKSRLIDVKEDGSFRLNLDFFDFHKGGSLVNDDFCRLFDGPPRLPESRITRREMDLAASIQTVTEEVMVALAPSEGVDWHVESLPRRRCRSQLRGERKNPARRHFRRALDTTGCWRCRWRYRGCVSCRLQSAQWIEAKTFAAGRRPNG
jgi:Carbamoyltransferase N-terminus